MKNMITIIAFATLFSCKAQNVYPLGTYDIPENGNYYVKDINNYHDDIIGVWRWEEGNSLFEITLQEYEESNYPNNSTIFYDRVFGKYKFINNGNLVAEVNSIEPLPDFKISLVFKTATEYSVVIRDIVSETGKIGEFILTSPTTATLELREIGGVKVNYGNGQEWALPTSVTLTKQ